MRAPSLILAPLLLSACFQGLPAATTDAAATVGETTNEPTTTAGESTDTTGVATSSTSSSPTTTSSTTTSSTSSTGPDTSTGEPPAEPAVHWVGRHDASDPGHVRMGWSGVGAVLRFAGTGASVRLDDHGRYFTVLVDGALQPTLATSPGEQSYVLASGLPDGEHTLELYRRTEGSFGATTVLVSGPLEEVEEVVGEDVVVAEEEVLLVATPVVSVDSPGVVVGSLVVSPTVAAASVVAAGKPWKQADSRSGARIREGARTPAA